MATSLSASGGWGTDTPATVPVPNVLFRELRGPLSPGEFAAAVRRAAREIGERVCCDARYIGRVEAGEIRCPNYAYERVFIHMFPGRTLADLGFESRQTVRGRKRRNAPMARTGARREASDHSSDDPEECDVQRRSFMTGGSAALASMVSLAKDSASPASPGRPGAAEARTLKGAVRDLRRLDDQHGADLLYRPTALALQSAYTLLDAGTRRQSVNDALHTAAGELAISTGWLAHDSGRYDQARTHYAEALATARVSGDLGLEAHAFCNTAFLARDTGHPREAVRAAQAGQQAARHLGSYRLLSLLALREAGGWAGLGDHSACEETLSRAATLFARGSGSSDPEWMSFFGEAEMASLDAQCWSALGDADRAAARARQAVALNEPRFARNAALYSAELAGYLAGHGDPEEAAAAGNQSADLLGQVGKVNSTRIAAILASTARTLRPRGTSHEVATFVGRAA